MHSFRPVFIAITLGFALIVAAFLVNRARPEAETGQPSAALVRASGKCAECHYRQQYSIVHEYEMSAHAQKHVSCLECHQPQANQERKEHHGFTITLKLTAANCRSCHESIYQEFLRSRHAAVSWAAVYGEQGLSAEQANYAEQFHPGYAKRPPHPFTTLEGPAAMTSGCEQCHAIGRPNPDGTVGSCTACHTRHTSSVAIAREPRTCGQCHMGPDHSQIEIYEESKHGIMFNAQSAMLNLSKPPRQLTTHDMWVPTCATCHMSGINGNRVTHDPSERLSYYLADAISKRRPNYVLAQTNMKQVCIQCHTKPLIERVYQQAEQVVNVTNQRVGDAKAIVDALRGEGALTGKPFTNRIDFVYFDFWHYDGRTSKHGAFMGGADFVQWHGNYPMLSKMVELETLARELRGGRARGAAGAR
jgi:hydroxylamine dehydrogenase